MERRGVCMRMTTVGVCLFASWAAGCREEAPKAPPAPGPIVIATDANDLERLKLRTGGQLDRLVGLPSRAPESPAALQQRLHTAGPIPSALHVPVDAPVRP